MKILLLSFILIPYIVEAKNKDVITRGLASDKTFSEHCVPISPDKGAIFIVQKSSSYKECHLYGGGNTFSSATLDVLSKACKSSGTSIGIRVKNGMSNIVVTCYEETKAPDKPSREKEEDYSGEE